MLPATIGRASQKTGPITVRTMERSGMFSLATFTVSSATATTAAYARTVLRSHRTASQYIAASSGASSSGVSR